ncbi:MAG TPA: hypothetical protein VL981_03580 [Candidatus Methylacidiphilales bacterium]|nr:hypothetical protein [Candidatus Methylacidiphilales bacterium]
MAISSKSRSTDEERVTVSFSDSIDLIHNQIHWTPKGVKLLTKWAFAEGTEVEFAFEHQGERHCCSGVVVACHPLRRPAGHFEVVLFFVDTPCLKLQKAACDCRLARTGEMSLGEDRYLNTFDGSARFAPRSRVAVR